MTKADQTHFSLTFTPGELFWLLTAFSNNPPAFLGQPFANQAGEKTRQALLAGAQSLIARGLIRSLAGSPTYQVEGGVAALLHWLCDSGRVILFRQIQREGNATGPAVCLADERALLVEINPTGYNLTLFRNIETLLAALMECLHLPADFSTQEGSASIISEEGISLPDPQSFVPLAWQNPAAARIALKRSGIPSKQVSKHMDWTAGLLRLMAVSENQVTSLFLAFSQKSAWSAQADNSLQNPILFSAFQQEDFRKMLVELLNG